FPADRIHKAVVEALVPGALAPVPETEEGAAEGGGEWYRRCSFATVGGRDRLTGSIGFRGPSGPEAERLLRLGGPLAVKVHYALWARAFADGGENAGEPVSHTLSRLCDDVGYARLRNGAHRPETKRQVRRILDMLASLEVHAHYAAPDGRTCRLE